MKKSVRFLAFAVLAGSIFAVTGCSDPHNHSYSTDWSNDETNHWHSATCEHKELKKDEGAHEGMEDGYCDVCNYHVHLFDESKYAFDENNHWFADTCGHDQKKGEEAHTTNKLGVCTVCGNKVAEPDLSTVAKAIEIGVMQKGEVNSGTVDRTVQSAGVSTYTVYGTFEIGDGFLYTTESYEIGGSTKTEFWYAIVNDTTVAFYQENGADFAWYNYEIEQEAVNGYFFDGNDIGNAGNKSYGVEDYLETLYEVGDVKAMDGTFAESVNEGVYSFSYDLYSADSSDDIFNISVSFELGEKYNVKSMKVDVERWYYATDSDSDGVFEKPDTASDWKSSTVISQTTGAPIEQDIKPEELLLSSFELYNGEEKVEDELTLECGKSTVLNIADMLPESASDLRYENFTATGIDANTGDEVGVDWWGNYMVSASKSNKTLTFNFKVLGTYEVTVHTRTLSKTFTVNVVRPATTELNVQVNGKNATTASVYLGDEVAFATVANQYADASATAVFTSKPDGSELIDADILVNESTGMFVFEPDVVGTYEITLTSVANPELEKTLTVTVEEKPAEVNVSSILNGKYKVVFYGTEMGTATFTPSNATATEGTVVLAQQTRNGLKEETFAYVYTGTVMEGTLALTFTGSGTATMSGWAFGISNGVLVNPANSSMQYQKVEEPVIPDEPTSPWEGAGTEADPYVITNFETDFTVAYTGENGVLGAVVHTFTSDKSGTLTLTFDTEDTWVLVNPGSEYSEKDTYEIPVVANQTYTLKILSWSEMAKNIGVSMSFEEGEVGGGDEGGEEKDPIWIDVGETSITVTADDITAETITCTFMPSDNGTYTFDGFLAIVYNDGVQIGRGQVSLEGLVSYTVELYVAEMEAGDYTLTISMEAEEGGDEGGDEVETNGFIDVETTDTYGWFDLYTFTAPAEGNYVFYLPVGLGLCSKGAYDNQDAPELDFYANDLGLSVSVYLFANEPYEFYVGATTKGEWKIYWEIGEVEEEPVVEDLWLNEDADNTITVTADDIAFESIDAKFMPMATAVYTFTSTDGLSVRIYDDYGMMVNEGTTLTAWTTYTVSIYVGGLEEAGDYVLTVAMVVEGGDEGGDDEGGDVSVPDGTQNNPYVITELPYEHKVTGKHDFYITYTATEDCTLKISYSAGCLVSDLPDGWVKDAENFFYTIAVTEGQVLKLNLWKTSGSDEYTYKFEKVVVVEPETPDVGGDEGGEDVEVVTYLTTHSNGRKMKVVVTKTSETTGKIAITRSDMTGNFTGGAVTSEYIYTIENGVVTTTLTDVSSSITGMTWNADGVTPVSIMWGGAEYKDFVIQEA